MNRGLSIVLIAALVSCRATFEVAPAELPLRGNVMRTSDGELVDVPRNFRATLVARRDASFMTPDNRSEVTAYALPEVTAYAVPSNYVGQAESVGWTDLPISIGGSGSERRGAVELTGQHLVVEDEHERRVHVPLAAIDHVEVVDEDARRANTTIAITLPSVVAGSGLVALLVFGFVVAAGGGVPPD